MRKLVVVAALALIATSAHAKEVHEIKFGGRVVRIEIPTNCNKPSCIQLSSKEKSTGRSRTETEPAVSAAPAASNAAGTAVAAPAPEPAKPASTQPTNAQSAPPTYVSPKVEPEAVADGRKPSARLSLPTSPAAEESNPAIASTVNPVGANEPRNGPKSEPAKPAEPSPVGLWLTEKGEGKVRIEECGQALCGFTEGKPNERILINMQPAQKNRWNGKIHDVRGGSTYASHMSLRNADSLRVEGCALGGLFCGGQTWTRLQ